MARRYAGSSANRSLGLWPLLTTANHRSYIVNMDRVKEIERMRIVIDADVRIAIGENYKADFQEYLRRHSLS